jgi:hypothetical protein
MDYRDTRVVALSFDFRAPASNYEQARLTTAMPTPKSDTTVLDL